MEVSWPKILNRLKKKLIGENFIIKLIKQHFNSVQVRNTAIRMCPFAMLILKFSTEAFELKRNQWQPCFI